MSYVHGSAWDECPGLGDGDVLVGGSTKKGQKKLQELLEEIEEEREQLAKVVANAKKQKQALKRLGAGSVAADNDASFRLSAQGRTSVNWPFLIGTAGLIGTGYWMLSKKKKRRKAAKRSSRR